MYVCVLVECVVAISPWHECSAFAFTFALPAINRNLMNAHNVSRGSFVWDNRMQCLDNSFATIFHIVSLASDRSWKCIHTFFAIHFVQQIVFYCVCACHECNAFMCNYTESIAAIQNESQTKRKKGQNLNTDITINLI